MVLDRVKEIIAEQMNIDESKITPETDIIKDLGADSLDTVELIMEFEKEFGLTIPDEKATDIVTVGDAIAYIQEQLG